MPYRSRLVAVLFQRKRREDDLSRAFLTAKNHLVAEQERLRLLEIKLQTTLDDLTAKQEGGSTSEEIALYLRFIGMLQGAVDKQMRVVLHQEGVCELNRAQLATAVKERKAVETIDGKREKDYLKAVTKKEQAVLDEIGGQLKMRQHV
ncbi:MAG: flagellar export protein FliJ [Nitrospirae bacterium]|nr:flagellar export protein FliJ [Candidatus Troglogloeales bacterium]MBI3598040.1 flagellar export protein FliJ [Candidatus Troglogloeales bacterium]